MQQGNAWNGMGIIVYDIMENQLFGSLKVIKEILSICK